MTELAQRFPEDITWEIPYDTTIFVKATIDKVVQTLFEAFVAGGRGGLRVPRPPQGDPGADHRRAGGAYRHLRR